MRSEQIDKVRVYLERELGLEPDDARLDAEKIVDMIRDAEEDTPSSTMMAFRSLLATETWFSVFWDPSNEVQPKTWCVTVSDEDGEHAMEVYGDTLRDAVVELRDMRKGQA